MELALLYVTYPDKQTAENQGADLLKKKWIACYNLYEMQSAYWWQGKITADKETTMILKTVAERVPSIQKWIEENHPYQTPCIIRLPFEANQSYALWIRNSVSPE